MAGLVHFAVRDFLTLEVSKPTDERGSGNSACSVHPWAIHTFRSEWSVSFVLAGFSKPPNSYPVNLHLLWKDGAAIRTADEVSTNRYVQDDEERSLKL